MANKKITELNAATSLAATDVVPVVDVSADETKKITATDLFRTLPDGTAAAPALSFGSDAANGLFLASSDTVGIATGGTQRVTVDGSGNVTISGDLQVNGATTTVQSTTVTIDDKNIELGSVASPSNTTADGGGITLKATSDKTIKWINSTGYWTFNTGIEVGGHLQIDDSNEIRLGTGQDLQIKHDGTHSRINDSGSGSLLIQSNGASIQLNKGTAENMLVANTDGAVDIYYDGSKKLATKSDGIDVTGELECDSLDVDGNIDIHATRISYSTSNETLKFLDNIKSVYGNGDDLQIYHDGSNSYIADTGTGKLFIRGNSQLVLESNNGENYLAANENGDVHLYYDGGVRISTKSDGANVVGELECDSLDVDGAADITGTVTLHGTLDLQDNDRIKVGADDDLQIWHDGSNSIIRENGTGALTIQSNGGEIAIYDYANSQNMGRFITAGAVELYHNGTKKFETRSNGVSVFGQASCNDLDVGGNADITGDVSISGGNKTVKTTAGFLQVGTSSSNHLAFITDGNERGRLDSVGRLLLGTTDEGHADADNFTVADGGHCGITIRSGTTSDGAIYFSDGITGNAEYRGYLLYDHNDDGLRFGTEAVERFRITSTGAWSIEGANNYGTSGQVLTSNGNDAPTWQDAGQAAIGGSNAISMNDNVKINFGGGNDLQIYHDGSNAYIDDAGTGNLKLNGNEVHILSNDNSEYAARFVSNGTAELYYDNGKRLETVTNGISVTGNVDLSGELNLMGTGDGAKYLDARVGSGGTFHIRGTLGGDANHESLATFTRDGAVKLFYDNSQKLQTKTDGVLITGELECNTLDVNGAINVSGVPVFQSNIGVGNTTVGNSFANGKAIALGDNDTGIRQAGDGILEFWANNQERLTIHHNGTTYSRNHFVPHNNNSVDLGGTNNRWRNVYTNDLNLSNEGSSNDVDGTWGSYTIQEGEDDLFLINRRNGKKYKFNLTEVS